MVFVTGKIGKYSGAAFREQQKNLGKVNGYIEEMIEGQKVVKVFCHEKQAKLNFEELNDFMCGCNWEENEARKIKHVL